MLRLLTLGFPASQAQPLPMMGNHRKAVRRHRARHEASWVPWPQAERRGLDSATPKTKQAVNTTATGALTDGFWGFLFGLIFFVPLLGFALGPATGALTGALTDVGINDTFIEETCSKVTRGLSALFLLSAGAVIDRVVPELRGLNPELVTTNLPTEQEARLRELFAGRQTQA